MKVSEFALLYRGFDGLDVAFQGRVPEELLGKLEQAKDRAIEEMQSVILEYRGVRMAVAESGSRGGYAFRCDTGPDGATWFFKRPKAGDPWGVRVSVKSLALALYGLGGVRARLYGFMEALGIAVPPGGESIGRVDYAVDILAPGFALAGDNFVMHSHTSRADHIEPEPMVRHGTSGRVTSVTVGMMPGRQVIVYDKRREIVSKRKVYWWDIWDAARQKRGEGALDREVPRASQIWRVELRAGKEHLKKSWGSKKWTDLDDRFGDLLLKTLADIRYTIPTADPNRARWPVHPLWQLAGQEVEGDLFEMMCRLNPNTVKEVLRREHVDMLGSQLRGLSASYAVARGLSPSEADRVPGMVERALRTEMKSRPGDFEERMARVAERYIFLDSRRGSEPASCHVT